MLWLAACRVKHACIRLPYISRLLWPLKCDVACRIAGRLQLTTLRVYCPVQGSYLASDSFMPAPLLDAHASSSCSADPLFASSITTLRCPSDTNAPYNLMMWGCCSSLWCISLQSRKEIEC